MLLTINDDMYFSVQIVRVLRVGTEEANDLSGIVAVFGKDGIESGNLSVP